MAKDYVSIKDVPRLIEHLRSIAAVRRDIENAKNANQNATTPPFASKL